MSRQEFERGLHSLAGVDNLFRNTLQRIASIAFAVAERNERLKRIALRAQVRSLSLSKNKFISEFEHDLLRSFLTNARNFSEVRNIFARDSLAKHRGGGDI